MAEKGIKRGEKIHLDLIANRFSIGEVNHPIEYLGPEEAPAPGITIKPYKIVDELEAIKDVAHVLIEPGFATPIQLFKGDRWIQDFVLTGKGIFIAVDEQGEVQTLEVHKEKSQDFLLAEYQKGWAVIWIAAKDGPGLELIEVTSPPWDPTEYDVLDINDSRLTDEFREKYKKFH